MHRARGRGCSTGCVDGVVCVQEPAFGIAVHDAPRRHGGQQRLITPDGYHIPLSYRDGLPILAMRPPTDDELSSLPHLLLTSDVPWIPSCLDDDFTCDEIVAPIDSGGLDLDPRVTDHGAYTGNLQDDIDIILHECRQTRSNNQTVTPSTPDLDALRPLFGWVPVDRIKKTIASTTQFARASVRLPLRKHFKSRFPACNVHRWNEDVATDTFFVIPRLTMMAPSDMLVPLWPNSLLARPVLKRSSTL